MDKEYFTQKEADEISLMCHCQFPMQILNENGKITEVLEVTPLFRLNEGSRTPEELVLTRHTPKGTERLTYKLERTINKPQI